MTVRDYCPHCGAPTLDESVPLVGGPRVLYELLRDNPGQWIPSERLESALYGGRPDGGPLSARNTVNVYIHHIRKKLGSGFIETRFSGVERGSYRWVGGEKQNGKARTEEEAGPPPAERTVEAGT